MKNSTYRLKQIIESDRLLLSADTSELICYDLKKVLNEFFNVEGGVTLCVEPLKDSYEVTIKAKASGIKSFGVIK